MHSHLLIMIALTGLLAFGATAQQAISGQATPPPRTITVTGTAQRMVPPDVGLVTFAVQTQADTVTAAIQENNTRANRLVAAIEALQLPHSTISTLGFNVQPLYQQPAPNHPVTQPQRIIGYQVTNQLQVRISAAEQAKLSSGIGQVLERGLASGANRVDSISFTLENAYPALQDALAEATRNAHAAATVMAGASGVQIIRLLTLNATPYYSSSPTPVFAARSAGEMANSVPIIAGPQTIQVTVNASYEIQ